MNELDDKYMGHDRFVCSNWENCTGNTTTYRSSIFHLYEGALPIPAKLSDSEKQQLMQDLKNYVSFCKQRNISFYTLTVAQIMIKSGAFREEELITIITTLDEEHENARCIAFVESVKIGLRKELLLTGLTVCKNNRCEAVACAINTGKFAAEEVVSLYQNYGDSRWTVAMFAIKTGILSPDQIIEIYRSCKQFLLTNFDRRDRQRAVASTNFKSFSIKQIWLTLLLTRCFRFHDEY